MTVNLPGDKFAPAGYLRPVAGGNGRMERMKPPRMTKDGKVVAASEIKIHGELEIRQRGVPGFCNVRVPDPIWWNPWRRKACGCGELHQVARNKIVNLGLIDIANRLAMNAPNGFTPLSTNTAVTINHYGIFHTNDQTRSTMRLGLGAAATTAGMTALVTEVLTAPNSTAYSADNPSLGVYRNKFTCVWNAGALAVNTIQEIGILAWLTNQAFNVKAFSLNNLDANMARQLFARLTATDGEFTAFTINPAVPLTVEYRVVLTFT